MCVCVRVCGVFIYLNLAKFFLLVGTCFIPYEAPVATNPFYMVFEMEIYRHLLHMLVSMVAFSFVVSRGTLWTFGRSKVLPRHAESTP